MARDVRIDNLELPWGVLELRGSLVGGKDFHCIQLLE